MKLQENYFIFQEPIIKMMKNYSNPVIWNTQRQMGKSTVLVKLITERLINSDGDYWFMGPNLQTDELIFRKIIEELEKSDQKIMIRNSRSRIEVITNNHTSRLLSPRKFSNILEGTNYPEPNGIFIDEVNIVGIDGIQRMLMYLHSDVDKTKINLYGVTTSLSVEIIEFFTKKFQAPEVITTNFLSKEMKYIHKGLSDLEINAQIYTHEKVKN